MSPRGRQPKLHSVSVLVVKPLHLFQVLSRVLRSVARCSEIVKSVFESEGEGVWKGT